MIYLHPQCICCVLLYYVVTDIIAYFAGHRFQGSHFVCKRKCPKREVCIHHRRIWHVWSLLWRKGNGRWVCVNELVISLLGIWQFQDGTVGGGFSVLCTQCQGIKRNMSFCVVCAHHALSNNNVFMVVSCMCVCVCLIVCMHKTKTSVAVREVVLLSVLMLV